ncbi:hypothetical protein L1987_01585 [Smallanthus sonchifolius]|uniref:Uncharacterized protein n=1 Tax=Smallanthus sonchifolius TaxID=185202 RepID=A0ACB9K5F5_9ASTR|nr:hypothetical protein L1987_01585 [Smallanthus sonchifolius]
MFKLTSMVGPSYHSSSSSSKYGSCPSRDDATKRGEIMIEDVEDVAHNDGDDDEFDVDNVLFMPNFDVDQIMVNAKTTMEDTEVVNVDDDDVSMFEGKSTELFSSSSNDMDYGNEAQKMIDADDDVASSPSSYLESLLLLPSSEMQNIHKNIDALKHVVHQIVADVINEATNIVVVEVLENAFSIVFVGLFQVSGEISFDVDIDVDMCQIDNSRTLVVYQCHVDVDEELVIKFMNLVYQNVIESEKLMQEIGIKIVKRREQGSANMEQQIATDITSTEEILDAENVVVQEDADVIHEVIFVFDADINDDTDDNVAIDGQNDADKELATDEVDITTRKGKRKMGVEESEDEDMKIPLGPTSPTKILDEELNAPNVSTKDDKLIRPSYGEEMNKPEREYMNKCLELTSK